MKTAELIDKYKDKIIKLSSGTGFIYCGKVDESLIGILEEYDKTFIADAKRLKEKEEKKVDKCIDMAYTLPRVIRSLENELKIDKKIVKEDSQALFKLEPTDELYQIKLQTIEELTQRIEELEGKKKNEGLIAIKKAQLEYCEKQIPKSRKNIDRLINYIENYKALIEREVLEEYNSIDQTDICHIDKIIKIEGAEVGRYWTVKEYQQGFVEEEEEDAEEVE